MFTNDSDSITLYDVFMFQLIRNTSLIFTLISILSNSLFAYEYTHKPAAELAGLIRNSIEQKEFQKEVLSRYAQLNRSEIPVQELLELKFSMQHWHEAMVQVLVAQSPTHLSEYHNQLTQLNLLGTRLKSNELEQVFHNRSQFEINRATRRLEQRLVGNQGNPNLEFNFLHSKELLRTGPPEALKIRALKPSRWTFDWWSSKKEQFQYDIRNGVTRYRGLALKSGDFLISDLAVDIAVFFHSISDRETLLPHLSIFVLAEKDGKHLPLVLEMYAPGLRAVPLNVYLAEHFTSYTEVYRLKDITDNHRSRMSEAALSMLKDRFRYSYTNTEDDHLTTCAGIGQVFLKNSCVKPIHGKSEIRFSAIDSLKALGLHLKNYLSPADYAIDPRTEFVGAVDNRLFQFDVSKQLLVHYLSTLSEQYRLDPKLMPAKFEEDQQKIVTLQKGGFFVNSVLLFIGMNSGIPARSMLYLSHTAEHVSSRAAKFFERFGKFYRGTFPDAPPETIAAVMNVSKPFSRAVQETQKNLEGKISFASSFSIHDFEEDSTIQSSVSEAAREMSAWFTKK